MRVPFCTHVAACQYGLPLPKAWAFLVQLLCSVRNRQALLASASLSSVSCWPQKFQTACYPQPLAEGVPSCAQPFLSLSGEVIIVFFLWPINPPCIARAWGRYLQHCCLERFPRAQHLPVPSAQPGFNALKLLVSSPPSLLIWYRPASCCSVAVFFRSSLTVWFNTHACGSRAAVPSEPLALLLRPRQGSGHGFLPYPSRMNLSDH